MKKFNLAIFFLLIGFSFSCKKRDFVAPPDFDGNNHTQEKLIFTKALGKALDQEKSLRAFIKSEALKQFDGDYDVLVQLALDKFVNEKETFYDIIKKYTPSESQLASALNSQPLLTIYVPELDEFSANSWNPENTIPMVAIRQITETGKAQPTPIYKADGTNFFVSPGDIPGFPVLVVKDNERIITEAQKNSITINDHSVKFLDDQPLCFQNAKHKLFFISSDFDNRSEKISNKRDLGAQRIGVPTSAVDPVVIAAYNSGAEWHRDYIYYGLDPSNNVTTGAFRNTYKECIRGIRFLNAADYKKIADDSNDPSVLARDPNNLYQKTWTDGRFEFNVSIFLNSTNGTGQELKKVFSIDPHSLFKYYTGSIRDINGNVIHTIYDIQALTASTDIEITSWDFRAYGSTWKISITEYDPSVEVTKTTTNASTFGANFEVTFPFKKLGFKFGINASTTNTTTYQYKTTTGSDFLGEGLLDFRDRIMVAPGIRSIEIDEVTTGMIALQVSPKKI